MFDHRYVSPQTPQPAKKDSGCCRGLSVSAASARLGPPQAPLLFQPLSHPLIFHLFVAVLCGLAAST